MALADLDTRTDDEIDHDVRTEDPYDVILWNDPVTPMPVVVLVLKRVFGYGQERAANLMIAAHRMGKAAVWTGDREQAVSYCVQLGTAGLRSTVAKS